MASVLHARSLLIALALALVAAFGLAAPAQADPIKEFKNSVNSASSIYVYNAQTCADGSPWILSVNETNFVNNCNNGLRVDRSYYSPHSYRWHYNGYWHSWHCDETSDPNPPDGVSPIVMQVENDHRC